MHPRHDRAFSIVELLVVVSIIAVLSGVLLPAVKTVRDSAKTVKCLSALRQIGAGALAYSTECRGFLPDCKGNGADWATRMSAFVEADNKDQDSGWGNFQTRGRVYGACPNAKSTGGPNDGFAMSYVLLKPLSSSGYSYALSASTQVQSFRLSQITYPGTRLFISERTGDQNIGGYGNLDMARHGRRVNAVFCDFHVESLDSDNARLSIDSPNLR